MKKRSIWFISLVAVLCLLFAFTACGNKKDDGSGDVGSPSPTPSQSAGTDPGDGYDYVDFKTDAEAAITVDGKIEEAVYREIPAFTTGIAGSATFYFAASKEGFYMAFEVADTALYYKDNASAIFEGDCIEFYLDPDNKTPASPKKTVRQVQVTPKGNYEIFKGDVTTTWVSIGKKFGDTVTGLNGDTGAEGFRLAVQADGTVKKMGTAPASSEKDTGWSGELFLSWESMGVDVKTVESNQYGDCGTVGVAFGHRDVAAYDDAGLYMNDVANQVPNKYRRLRLAGSYKGVSVPSVASEIVVDGVMDEAEWNSAAVIGADKVTAASGNATINARAFFGNNGLYLGVTVTGDTKLEVPVFDIANGVYKNDGCEYRIHLFDAEDNEIRSFKLLYYLYGMAWHDSPAGTPGAADELCAFHLDGTINDNSDTDTGWSMELFIPNYELNADSMKNGALQHSREVSYARVMVGVQNYYVTNSGSTEPMDQSPEVAIPTGCSWDSVNTYVKISK